MVEWKKLGDLCNITTGKLNANQKDENGIYPFFTCDAIPYKINKYAFDTEAILLSGNGSQVGHLNYYKGKFNAYQRTYVLDDFKGIQLFYLFHYLKSTIRPYIMKSAKKGAVPYITLPMLTEFQIPIPSKSEQERIVSILDTFTSSIANLKEQIKERRKQYEHYRDQLLDLEGKEGVEMKTLGNVCEITDYVANGSFASLRENVEYKQEPDYALLVRTVDLSQNFEGDKIYINEHAYNFLAKSVLHGGEIIINNIGAGVGKTFRCPYLNMKMSLAPNSIMVRTPNNDFYYYWFSSLYGQTAMSKIITPGAMPKFNKTGFKTIVIPIPFKSEQSRIVSILDQFEASIANLEAQLKEREKQYEYYRNQLLTFE